MTSFVQYITGSYGRQGRWGAAISGDGYSPNSTGENAARTTLFDYIRTLPPYAQLRFIADQTLAISYFLWLYGSNAHKCMTTYSQVIKEYTEEVLKKSDYTDAVAYVYQAVLDIQSSWYGKDWIDVPIASFAQFVYLIQDINPDTGETYKERGILYPAALTLSAAVPYLMHRNRVVQKDFAVYTTEVHVPTYEITAYSYGKMQNYGFIKIYNRVLGTNFFAKISDRYGKTDPNWKEIVSAVNMFRTRGYTFLELLLKCDLSTKSFECVVGLLGQMCLHRDWIHVHSPNFSLFYRTAAILNNMFSADFIDVGIAGGDCPLEYPTSFYPSDIIFTLMSILNRTSGVKVRDRNWFIRFFDKNLTKDKRPEIQKIVDFVKHTGENVASAEELSIWNASILSGCEAIDLTISDKSVSTLVQGAGTVESVDETANNDDEDTELNEIIISGDAEAALEAEAATTEEEEDTSTDSDENSDDSSSEDGNDDDGDSGDEGGDEDDKSNLTGDDNKGGDDAGASDPAAANDTQANATPEDVNASDDEGIAFIISPEGSETVDTVVLREELDEFISEVLANPPKRLAPQTVSALTKLQKCWLHILSVETITGILEKLIDLPDKFKTIKENMGENNHE